MMDLYDQLPATHRPQSMLKTLRFGVQLVEDEVLNPHHLQ